MDNTNCETGADSPSERSKKNADGLRQLIHQRKEKKADKQLDIAKKPSAASTKVPETAQKQAECEIKDTANPVDDKEEDIVDTGRQTKGTGRQTKDTGRQTKDTVKATTTKIYASNRDSYYRKFVQQIAQAVAQNDSSLGPTTGTYVGMLLSRDHHSEGDFAPAVRKNWDKYVEMFPEVTTNIRRSASETRHSQILGGKLSIPKSDSPNASDRLLWTMKRVGQSSADHDGSDDDDEETMHYTKQGKKNVPKMSKTAKSTPKTKTLKRDKTDEDDSEDDDVIIRKRQKTEKDVKQSEPAPKKAAAKKPAAKKPTAKSKPTLTSKVDKPPATNSSTTEEPTVGKDSKQTQVVVAGNQDSDVENALDDNREEEEQTSLLDDEEELEADNNLFYFP